MISNALKWEEKPETREINKATTKKRGLKNCFSVENHS